MKDEDKLRSDDFRFVLLGTDFGCPHCTNVYFLPKGLIKHIENKHAN